MAAPFTVLTDAELRKQLSTAPAPAYLLYGEEDYLKNFAVNQAREQLGGDAAFACFNEIILDALDFTAERLRQALMPLPMMAVRKLVLVRGLDFESMKPSELDALCEALDELSEYDYNTVIIPVAAGLIDEGYSPKSPSRILKKLAEHVTLVRFERCTPAKLNGWCVRHFKHHGVDATSALCNTLIESCGRSMLTLAGEIEKISYYVLAHGRTEATVADVKAAACTTTEYDTYAFSNALMERNLPRALDILSDLKFRRVEPLFILSEVITTVSNMLITLHLSQSGATNAEVAKRLSRATGKFVHEYTTSLYRQSATRAGKDTLRRMLEACQVADRALKLSPKGYAPLEALICSLG